MKQVIRAYFLKLAKIGVGGIILLLLAELIVEQWDLPAVITGNILSFLFILSNFFIIRKIPDQGHKSFFKLYVILLAIRFLIVLTAFAFVLAIINFSQIFFTVSFIISYIFHSVIEIIFINKILDNENLK